MTSHERRDGPARSQATRIADLNLLEVAVSAARAAALVIRERTADRASLRWDEKAPTDFVSAVDLAAEERIRAVIGRLMPGAAIAAEEGSPDLARDSGLVFVVDPLDGTTNFLHGYPAYAVSIGVLCDGRLAAGVVHNVVTGNVYTAADGHGAWCGPERLQVSSIARPSRALVGTGIPFTRPWQLAEYLPQMDRVARQASGIRRAGSAALDLVDVARGRLDAFWELTLAPWDVAAGLLLVREAGGVVTDRAGIDAMVAHGAIVAGNPEMHRWLLAELAAADAARAAATAPAASVVSLPGPPRVALREGGAPAAIIECVPNFSEGRRPEVVAAIGDAIAAVEGATVLDLHSDRSHNRSVITFVASPGAAVDSALAGIREAALRIDLNEHLGVHPRLGAADVVPFVPLGGATMAQCVELAHELGRRVAGELEIPVYLYEHAATRPERRNLADVRRGGYELLREQVLHDPARAPDYGPPRFHPTAGAVVIGARDLLVAFNVFLGPASNLPQVREIARAVRESSGGLPAVKALALEVDGQAQLSMNLVDISRTPVHVAYERVRSEAAALGLEVAWSEVVGLMPERSLWLAGAERLALRPGESDRLLEPRLRERVAPG